MGKIHGEQDPTKFFDDMIISDFFCGRSMLAFLARPKEQLVRANIADI